MKILVAEYAVGAGISEFMLEGRAMLGALVQSFVNCGHEVLYPTSGALINTGTAVRIENFENSIADLSKDCDAGLVIAPDEILGDLTEILEDNTANLGSPADAVRLCADKLECTRVLEKGNIPVPETLGSGKYHGDYVIKPRFGCASEGIHRSLKGTLKEGFIATHFIEGEHLSVSVITGKTQLPLTVNRQFIEIDGKISYKGGLVPHHCERNEELIRTTELALALLGCKGYAGVDIVLEDKPYVVDVNPRVTTSVIGITRVLLAEIADLILRSRFGELPEHVSTEGSFSFRKEDLSGF